MVIVNLVVPTPIKKSCITLGHIGYYHRFMHIYAQIGTQLEKLLKRDRLFVWIEECQIYFDELKEKLVIIPIIAFLDWTKEFHVHVDASSIMLGIIPTQPRDREIDHTITFASRKLSTTEKNYTTIETKGLAMVYFKKKCCHYLLASHFKLHTNKFSLKYIAKKIELGGEFVNVFFSFKNMIFNLLSNLVKHMLD